MKKILISDLTLNEIFSQDISFREKLDQAKRLDKVKADYIEIGPITDNADGVLVKTIASFLQNSVLTCVATNKDEIDKAVECFSPSQKKRIQINIPASIVQIEYNLHLKPNALMEKVKELVTYAKEKCDNVEVCFADATRSEDEILNQLIAISIDCGANAITLVDNAGIMLADEFSSFISGLFKKIPTLKNVELYIQATNRFRMSMSTILSGIKAGATGIKTEQNAQSSVDIVTVFDIIREVGDKLGVNVNLSATDVRCSLTKAKDGDSQQKSEENKEIEISTVEALERLLVSAGYELNKEELDKVFQTYTSLRQKKIVGSKELDVIVATTCQEAPQTYKLINYVVNSGNIITATTSVTLEKDGMTFAGLSAGDGPIDSSFKAIESIIGVHYELDEFSIDSITEGREAIGEAVVKLRSNGKLFSGVGISTDIIGASIQAYLSALNKIIYEETK